MSRSSKLFLRGILRLMDQAMMLDDLTEQQHKRLYAGYRRISLVLKED